MHKIPLIILLAHTIIFANEANANLGSVMANAATGQMIKMVPLFILAIGIAIFFSLVQKNPQKAALGCGGFFAIAFVLGVISLFLEFIANHAFLFILLALTLIVVCLVVYMIYTPPNPKNK
jgi:surface polysaccharide O-acyltransferase-like enzyme